jgi:hypothetical protein
MPDEPRMQKMPPKNRKKIDQSLNAAGEGLQVSVETSPSFQTGKKVADKVHECLEGMKREFQELMADDAASPTGSKSGFSSGPPGFRLEEWSVTLHADVNGEVSWVPFVAKGGVGGGGSLTFTFKRDNRVAGTP